MLTNISTFFGVMALVRIGLGILGTVADTVTQRVRELALRMVLGATRTQMARLVMRGPLTPLCLGLIAGLPLAYLSGDIARSVLFGVTSTDPLAYITSVALLVVVAAIAALTPPQHFPSRSYEYFTTGLRSAGIAGSSSSGDGR